MLSVGNGLVFVSPFFSATRFSNLPKKRNDIAG
jgi:hypothetical protein